MSWFIRKSLLKEANNTIENLNKELELIKKELSEIKESEDYLGYIEFKKRSLAVEEERTNLEKKIESAHNELEIINSAKLESDKIIRDSKCKAEEILRDELTSKRIRIDELESKIKLTEENLEERENIKESLNQEIEIIKSNIEAYQDELSFSQVEDSITSFEELLDGPASDEIKELLEKNKDKQKEVLRENGGYEIKQGISFNNSSSRGKAMQKRHATFLVTAFNAEVDNLISNTKISNFVKNASKIEKWFNKANKNADDSFVEIDRRLLTLRLEEHRYFFEYKYKKEIELDEQRSIKEAIKEEAKIEKEIKDFVLEREKEEDFYKNKISEEMSKLEGKSKLEIENLNRYIEELKLKLERASSEKERAISMAQLTRSGYVYIISNKGSFGEGVYKIGMTRRLQPMDRVKELGVASVPFYFDVHALIPSEDAPALEAKLHARFSTKRVNKINTRREFFKVTFDEIEEALEDISDTDYNLIRDVVSSQYEESKYLERDEG